MPWIFQVLVTDLLAGVDDRDGVVARQRGDLGGLRGRGAIRTAADAARMVRNAWHSPLVAVSPDCDHERDTGAGSSADAASALK